MGEREHAPEKKWCGANSKASYLTVSETFFSFNLLPPSPPTANLQHLLPITDLLLMLYLPSLSIDHVESPLTPHALILTPTITSGSSPSRSCMNQSENAFFSATCPLPCLSSRWCQASSSYSATSIRAFILLASSTSTYEAPLPRVPSKVGK